MANEKALEQKLKKEIEKIGGLAIKFYSAYFTGLPDRIILLPGGIIKFVEVKSTGKKPTPRQRIVIQLLQKLGFAVYVIDSEELLNDFLNSL